MKDTCWMLEWKVLGIGMIIPTILVAIMIAWKTRKTDEFFVQLAICFWITANSYWMICEFVDHEDLKNYAGIAFVAGMLSVAMFYIRRLSAKRSA